MQPIQYGAKGYDVIEIQKALGITADGIFGMDTQTAVMAFQTDNSLLADGIIGPVTWAALGLPAVVTPPVPPTSENVHGVDTSHWNGLVDWDKVKGFSPYMAIGFAKATEGADVVDDQFKNSWPGIKAAGLRRCAYHFFHPAANQFQAATLFAKTVGILEDGDLIAMDWETHEGTIQEEIAAAQLFLATVEQIMGHKPGIYIGEYYANELGNPVWMADHWLWLAEYTKQPVVPAPWKGYTFWQYSGSGVVPGTGKAVDLNIAGGDLEWLNNFKG